jgi:hypothetical protein
MQAATWPFILALLGEEAAAVLALRGQQAMPAELVALDCNPVSLVQLHTMQAAVAAARSRVLAQQAGKVAVAAAYRMSATAVMDLLTRAVVVVVSDTQVELPAQVDQVLLSFATQTHLRTPLQLQAVPRYRYLADTEYIHSPVRAVLLFKIKNGTFCRNQ